MQTMNTAGCFALAIAIMLSTAPTMAHSTECTGAKSIGENVYEVSIDAAPYIAVPRQQFLSYVKMEEKLKGAQDKIIELNGEIVAQKGIIEEKQKQINDQAGLIAKADEVEKKWRTATDKCEVALKDCLGTSRLSVELGGGMTSESDAIGLVGIGYGQFRVWGTFRNGESAGFVGIHIPLLK